MKEEFRTIRITAKAREALDRIAKRLSKELGVPVDLTYAASIAIINTDERQEEAEREKENE